LAFYYDVTKFTDSESGGGHGSNGGMGGGEGGARGGEGGGH